MSKHAALHARKRSLRLASTWEIGHEEPRVVREGVGAKEKKKKEKQPWGRDCL
jgi:hypothetical protein